MTKTTERNIMKRLSSVLFALGLTGILSIGGLSPAVGQAKPSKSKKNFTVDVACNGGGTVAINEGGPNIGFGRGNLAIVNGNIYPGGTLLDTADDAPTDLPLPLGTWRCLFVGLNGLGSFTDDIIDEQPLGGAVTYYFAIGPFADDADEDGLILVQGLNSHADPQDSVPRVHAIVGGTGRFDGATGQVLEEVIRQNATGCFDLRFHFSLKKKPK